MASMTACRCAPRSTSWSAPGSSTGACSGCLCTTARWRSTERDRLTTVWRRYAGTLASSQLVPAAVDRHERVLHDLLGATGVTEQEHGEPDQPHVVLVVQPLQGDIGVGVDGHPLDQLTCHVSRTFRSSQGVYTPVSVSEACCAHDCRRGEGRGLPVLQDRRG